MGCSSENRVFILVGFQKACCLHTFLVQAVRAVVYAIAPGDAAVFYGDSLEELLVSQGCKAGEVVNFFYVEKPLLVVGESYLKHEVAHGFHRNRTGEQGLAVDNLFHWKLLTARA